MPMRWPSRPWAAAYRVFSQRPARRSAVASAMRRSSERTKPIASSATAIAFLPGQLAT